MKAIGTILVCLLAASFAFGQNTGVTPPVWFTGSTTLSDLESDADTVELRVQQMHDIVNALRDSLEDANDHLQALRGVTTGFVGENVWTTVEVVVNFAAAGAWEEAASTHELFTVTGDVEFEISAFCSTDVTVTSGDSIFFGGEGGADDFFGIYRFLGSDATAGEALFRGVSASDGLANIPTAAVLDGTGGVWKGTAWMGQDIGYDIDDNDFTAGIVVFYCRWRPITTGGTVAAGSGGAL